MLKWLAAIGAILLAVVAVVTVFTVAGVIPLGSLVWDYAGQIAWIEPHRTIYEKGLDVESWMEEEQTRLQQAWDEITAEKAALEAARQKLETDEAFFERQQQEVASMAREIEAEQERQQSVERFAAYYQAMPADEAARILQELDDDVVLHLLTAFEEPADVAEVLQAFPTELAAALTARMSD